MPPHLISLCSDWMRKRYLIPYNLRGQRPGPEVIRAGELALPLTTCSTWESGPCTSPRRHSRADLSGRGSGETALRV